MGSGNVFADIGLPDPEEALAKARLALAIMRTIKERGLTQAAAARQAGVKQPQISNIVGGRLAPFSRDRLMDILAALGKDVDVVIKDSPKSRSQGRVRVMLPGVAKATKKDAVTAAGRKLRRDRKRSKALKAQPGIKAEGAKGVVSKVFGRKAEQAAPDTQRRATEHA